MTSSLNAIELNALIEVSRTVNAHLDLDDVLESVMSVTTEVMRVEASSLVLEDDNTGNLLFHIARGEHAKAVKPICLKRGQGVVGWVIENGKSLIVNDVTKDDRFYSKVDEESGFTTRSVLCVPMATNERVWGAIEIINTLDGRKFDYHDLVLCEAIANQASIAVENTRLHTRIVQMERMAAIGQTVAGLAHCIKNVLNGIQGGSYMIDLGLRKEDTAGMISGWKIVKKNNAFLQDLVLDMLTYSKERKPEYKKTNINEIVEAACTLMATESADKGVNIQWTANEKLNEVVIDPKGIHRCLLNMLSNAVDACESPDEGGLVTVLTEVIAGGMFQITITDNGCGIKEEDREKIFRIFFSTKGSKGTGLGLAVTHRIITEHRGTIEVDSEQGQGTHFVIKLPLSGVAEVI